ncbi:MAG: type IV secretion protein Rhs [Neisseria sp.]|nr:type IV secretion protein Rhs [Neisseria sp.]
MGNKRWRGLTPQETAVARRVFGSSMDYGRVRIYRGIPLLPALNVAVAPCNHIYFPRNNCPADFTLAAPNYQVWLIHELTHVWQHQQGYRPWLGGLLLAVKGGYHRRSAYVYPPLQTIRRFAELNMEQQADLIAHYYAARYLEWPHYRTQLPMFQTALQAFLDNPADKALLPKYRNRLGWFDWHKG